VISYFDTSALVPLVVSEPSTGRCEKLWRESSGVVVTRLAYVEAAAALSQANRAGRLSSEALDVAHDSLSAIWADCAIRELDESLMIRASELAHRFALRGYDAVHCAAAAEIAGEDIVAATGDKRLLSAWNQLGVATMDTNGGQHGPP
jgi:uncharacterized protein